MTKAKKKQEALSVSRLINEVLVAQLSIPFRQIVNDTSFAKYTGSKRPDILISEFEYDGTNDDQFIQNLVAYAEAKDDCAVDDKDWKDAVDELAEVLEYGRKKGIDMGGVIFGTGATAAQKAGPGAGQKPGDPEHGGDPGQGGKQPAGGGEQPQTDNYDSMPHR